jgi:hypothetical protein
METRRSRRGSGFVQSAEIDFRSTKAAFAVTTLTLPRHPYFERLTPLDQRFPISTHIKRPR